MRILVLRRRILAGVGLVLAAVSILRLVSHPKVVGASATTRQLPVYCVQADYPVVSLSFDAAWGNEDTQTLIDILDKYQVKATFFVVGEWVDKYPRDHEPFRRPCPLQQPHPRADQGESHHLRGEN